nr:U32 family peptidase [Desulfurispora thermophila]
MTDYPGGTSPASPAKPKRMELLAPAGDWTALVAAVANGADAVYLGGKSFSARAQAANFERQELARAVEYAHLRGVKIYVTVNTLLADAEMSEALDFLAYLQQVGADAVIVQDLGLIRMARRFLPELPLHASTQMTVHNAPAARHLAGLGIKRVVLARELSLGEIGQIKEQAGVEVEVFGHGALCICYSGQCLLSSMIGGRSGNRGRCAQPCRLAYSLVDAKGRLLVDEKQHGRYLLSPRDLNTAALLPRLLAAGVDALKIEGRMKRPEYVATVVRVYRQLLDMVAENRDYHVPEHLNRELAQIFNRDFTAGYLLGQAGYELMSYKRPNNRGVRLGRVKSYRAERRLVEIQLEDELQVGDGLEIWVSDGGRAGFEVTEIWSGRQRLERAAVGQSVLVPLPPGKYRVRPGDRVFKTHAAALVARAQVSYARPEDVRRLPLHLQVRGGPGKPLQVTAVALAAHLPDGRVQATGATSSPGQAAEKNPLDEEVLRRYLGRLGGTVFYLASLQAQLAGEVFYPVSQLNELRRQLVEDLKQQMLHIARPAAPLTAAELAQRRAELYRLPAMKTVEGDLHMGSKNDGRDVPSVQENRAVPWLTVIAGTLDAAITAVQQGADVVYWGADNFHRLSGRELLAQAAELGRVCAAAGARWYYSTPRIMPEAELERQWELLEKLLNLSRPPHGVLVGNLGLWHMLRDYHPQLTVVVDWPLNVFNRVTRQYFIEQGAVRVTLSPELSLSQLQQLLPEGYCEVLVHGAQELLVSRHCLPGSLLGGRSGQQACRGVCRPGQYYLRDRMGAVFPLETDRQCHMHIFNSRHLCLLEDIPALVRAGVYALRIEARREGTGFVTAAVRAYRRILAARSHEVPELAGELKQQLAAFSPQGFTKGHLYRGV